MRTPDGAATQRLVTDASTGTVHSRAWGPGAAWVNETLPELLGEADDPSSFVPAHPVLIELWRRYGHWRVPRSRRVLESLVPSVIEQKVTGMEARRSWRRLVVKYGEPAPGPAPDGLRVQPTPEQWAAIPSWEWHRAGVGPNRSATIVRAAKVAYALERTTSMSQDDADRGLRRVPGVGVWTSAEVRQRAHGDADAVSIGDFHIARNTCYALTGEVGDDDRMLELLEPYVGHRFRVTRLIELAGIGAPRRGPRYAPLDHRGR
ncbi:MAG: DNA-3-methyladenine glycosylase 2 family protein [Candidatus Nanopelagicales bacterium]